MVAASLESLTNELFEQVVQHLQCLDDIRNLRRVSRSTAFKAAQDTYRRFFRKKHVDLTKESLQCFVEVTSRSGLGCYVEDLFLVGVAYDPKDLQELIKTGKRPRPRRSGSSRKVQETYATSEELEAAKEDLTTLDRRRKDDEACREEGSDVVMLSKAFSNIVASKRNPLERLSLRIKTHRGDTVPKPRRAILRLSKSTFQVAANTFRLAMESLCNSQLKLQALDVFFAWHEQLECSLPCDALHNHEFTFGRLGPCLSTLKVLSVSITDPMVRETKNEAQSLSEEEGEAVSAFERETSANTLSGNIIANEENYSALSEMLQLCPSLEELNIVGYQLDYSDEELPELQKTMRGQHLHHLARATHFPRLRKVNLSNVEAQDNDLLTFLIKHNSSLRELELTMIKLPEGCFPSVVAYTAGLDNGLEVIRFEDVREGRDLVHFQCDWEREGVDQLDRDVVKRWGAERKADLSYFGRELGLLGSPVAWQWTLERPIQEDDDMVH